MLLFKNYNKVMTFFIINGRRGGRDILLFFNKNDISTLEDTLLFFNNIKIFNDSSIISIEKYN